MDKCIKAALEASPSAMLVLREGKIALMNSRATDILGCQEGAKAFGLIPDHILFGSSDSFVSTAIIKGKSWTVHVENSGDSRYISLEPERSQGQSPELLSEGLMSSLLSSLFNIGLTAERLGGAVPADDVRIEKYLELLNHNYFSMRHSLMNLSTAISLKKAALPFAFRPTDLCRLCSELCSTVAIMCRHRGLSIEFSTRLGELFAFVDSEKVERIVLNLLSNAIAHTPSGGRVSLGLEKSGDNAYISVDDTGRGIPASKLSQIFTAYERELTLSEMADFGGGLGLGIARGLAEAHDGAIIIESREGKGTSVRVMLPLKSHRLSVLESPGPDYLNSGMTMILTELAPVLDAESCSKKFMD